MSLFALSDGLLLFMNLHANNSMSPIAKNNIVTAVATVAAMIVSSVVWVFPVIVVFICTKINIKKCCTCHYTLS